jgi:cytochrome c553
MFRTKNNIIVGLALVVLLTAAAAFAREENVNPLTGQVGVAPDDESSQSIKLRSGMGDPVAGKEKSLLCQGCHGEVGISLEGLIPKLAGQYAKYIAKQVRNYQSGSRSHQIMNAMAATVSDDDLADIAAYFASVPKMKGNGSNNEVGKKLFLHGDLSRTILGCVNCHGVNGKGLTPNTSMFPVIGGQQKDYIRRQLVNFRKYDRTNSPNGIMNKIAQKLSDDEIEALADYVSGQ